MWELTLLFTAGLDKFKTVGVSGVPLFFGVNSHTTGPGSTITVNANFPTFQITDSNQPFYVTLRAPVTVHVRTKRWDMGNPNSLKRFSRALVQAQSYNPMTISLTARRGNSSIPDITTRGVFSFNQQPVQGLYPVGGNFRSQSLLIDISANGYAPTLGGGPGGTDVPAGQTPMKFKLYGIDVYAQDHGQQDLCSLSSRKDSMSDNPHSGSDENVTVSQLQSPEDSRFGQRPGFPDSVMPCFPGVSDIGRGMFPATGDHRHNFILPVFVSGFAPVNDTTFANLMKSTYGLTVMTPLPVGTCCADGAGFYIKIGNVTWRACQIF